MKKIIWIFIYSMISLGILLSCETDIAYKEQAEPIQPVSNLNCQTTSTAAELSWDLPTQYPEDIIQPVSVQISVFRNGVNTNILTISDAPTEYTLTGYDPLKKYRFIIKVEGEVDTDDPYKSKVRFSPGRSIECGAL